MVIEFVKGQAQKFIATRDFALNFDDKRMPSTKIRKGDIVRYDGVNVSYGMSGDLITGRCMGLKSAINVAKWLIPMNGSEEKIDIPVQDKFSSIIKTTTEDYDAKKGGSFETYANKNNDAIYVNKTGRRVIKEEERIVKNLEVVGDQVSVKDIDRRLIVNSSTSLPNKTTKRTMPIVQSEGVSGEEVAKISIQKVENQKSKNSYVVDDNTPRPTHAEMSIKEVRNITGRGEVIAVESQEATIIKKIKPPEIVTESEGIILRKNPPKEAGVIEIEGITMRKVEAPKDFSIKTTVSSGGNIPIMDTVQVTEAPKQLKEESVKKATERAEARKKSASSTQKIIEQEKKISEPIKEKKSASEEQSKDFLTLLPDDWGKLHWVKKEKFINELENIDFIKFILSVETIKAVQNACTERLKELEQKKNS